jgi:ABC-type sugar transport system ATPase subunit
MQMEEYRLKIANMSKSFPGVKALDNVNLKVEKGEILSLR